tara:strand:- start:850 stop:1116 length:267 start_codon:yes stop_codon:yes gene_type:complete
MSGHHFLKLELFCPFARSVGTDCLSVATIVLLRVGWGIVAKLQLGILRGVNVVIGENGHIDAEGRPKESVSADMILEFMGGEGMNQDG